MPETVLASTSLPPTGDRVLTPPLTGIADNTYRIALEGVFTFQGMLFDAVYKVNPDGSRGPRHNYLRWWPSPPSEVESDPVRHRYVFEVAAAPGLEGRSLGLQLDVDRLVDETLLTPSEVRSGLSVSLTVSTLQIPLSPSLIWPRIAIAAVPTLAGAGGIAWVFRRRMAFRGLDADLVDTLGRIERKSRAALAALTISSGSRPGLRENLMELGSGAKDLARRAQDLRAGRAIADSRMVELEIAMCRQNLGSGLDAARRGEVESILREKEKTLQGLRELERAESQRLLRLAKIEAVLDASAVILRSVAADSPAHASRQEESLCREVSAEVSALREVAAESAAQELRLTV